MDFRQHNHPLRSTNFFQRSLCITTHHQETSFHTTHHLEMEEDRTVSLTKIVTKEEVTSSLDFTKLFKEPGPNGLQCIFSRFFLLIMGNNILNLVTNASST